MTEQYIENRNNNKKKYDLEERTALFGEAIIDFAKSLSFEIGALSFDIHLSFGTCQLLFFHVSFVLWILSLN